MNEKRFTMIDEDFVCDVCGKHVLPLKYSARDHCPNCLCSKHLDVNPGDRNSKCKGIMHPIGVEKFKKSYKIIYQCDKCKRVHKNIMAQDDNMDLIIKIMSSLK